MIQSSLDHCGCLLLLLLLVMVQVCATNITSLKEDKSPTSRFVFHLALLCMVQSMCATLCSVS